MSTTPDRPDDDEVLRALERQLAGDDAATGPGAGATTTAGGAGDDDLGFTVPDDLGALQAQRPVTRAVLLTQVATAQPLAAACALSKVDADVVPTPVGAVAVLRDPTAGATAAGALSALLRGLPVVLVERRSGELSAARWTDGAHAADLAPGLVLSDVPEVLEDLLLTDLAVDGLEGVVTSVGMSRVKAMATLTRFGRRKG
ncbi:hypothetical protein [Cellulomonas endophytica]|uniref:hypothetical protein n=1 Tax=Cellulomonas endophytica TaxID=2494735 RepID=UPI001F0C3481|nr:hypothetical protein [Cellulomonas endophytica]